MICVIKYECVLIVFSLVYFLKENIYCLLIYGVKWKEKYYFLDILNLEMLELDQISLNGIIFLFSELQEKTVSDSDIFQITRIETLGKIWKILKYQFLIRIV